MNRAASGIHSRRVPSLTPRGAATLRDSTCACALHDCLCNYSSVLSLNLLTHYNTPYGRIFDSDYKLIPAQIVVMGQQSSQMVPTPGPGVQQPNDFSQEVANSQGLEGALGEGSEGNEIEARSNSNKADSPRKGPDFVRRAESLGALKEKMEGWKGEKREKGAMKVKKVKKSKKEGKKKNDRRSGGSDLKDSNVEPEVEPAEPVILDGQQASIAPEAPPMAQSTQGRVDGGSAGVKEAKKLKKAKKFKGRPSAVQIFPSREANEDAGPAEAEKGREKGDAQENVHEEVVKDEQHEAQAERPKKRRRQMAFDSPEVPTINDAPQSAEPQSTPHDKVTKPKKRRRKVSFKSPKPKDVLQEQEEEYEQADDAMEIDQTQERPERQEPNEQPQVEDGKAQNEQSPERVSSPKRIAHISAPVPNTGDAPLPSVDLEEFPAKAEVDRRAAAERTGVNYEEALAGLEDQAEKKKPEKKKKKKTKAAQTKDAQSKPMPTPPESDQPARAAEKKDLNTTVKKWLDSQQTPDPEGANVAADAPEQVEGEPEQEPAREQEQEQKQKQKKRRGPPKRNRSQPAVDSAAKDAEAQEAQADEEPGKADKEQALKKRRGLRNRRSSQPAADIADEDNQSQKARSDSDDDELEYIPEPVSEPEDMAEAQDDAEPDAQLKKKRARKLSGTARKPQVAQASPGGAPTYRTSGLFTKQEKATVEQVVVDYLEGTGKERWELEHAIIDWLNMDANFKNAIFEALPHRTKATLRKHCQTRYLPSDMARGKWTAEEDNELRRLWEEMPDQWTSISDTLNRGPLACRSRWATIKHADVRETGPWSSKDEALLLELVERACEVVRKNSKETDAKTDAEKYVDWNTIVEQMGHKRDKKHAQEKWKRLKNRRTADPTAHHDLSTIGKKPTEMSKKMRRVEVKFKALQCGDFFDALMEIHRAMKDDTKHYAEESTFWSVISLRNKGSRFPGPLRRRAFYDCLEKHGDGKATAPSAALALELAKRLEYVHGEAQVRSCYGLEPDNAMEARDKLAAEASSAAKTAPAWDNARKAPKQVAQPLSGEFVHSEDEASNEEEQGAGAAEQAQPEPEPEPKPEPEILDELPLSSIDEDYDGYVSDRPSPTLGRQGFLARLSGEVER